MKTRILLAVDRPHWAFHHIARQMRAYLADEFEFKIVSASDAKGACDILVLFWWTALPDIQARVAYDHLVVSIYDHLSWARTEGDRDALRWVLGNADVVTACNIQMAQDLASPGFAGRASVMHVEDGVDTALFQSMPLPTEFKVGWCGNSAVGYGRVKGLDLITEACERAGVPFACMDAANCGGLPHWMMASWYRGISAYVCASSADGTPNPPLEALACGRPVVSTRCGVMPRIIQNGYNGLLVDRDVVSIAEGIDRLRRMDVAAMGANARVSVANWDWSRKIESWRCVLRHAKQCKRISVPAIIKTRPRGLLVADVREWAFDINERDMVEYCKDEFDLDQYYLADKIAPPNMGRYRFSFLPYHRWHLDHYWQGVPYLGSLRSQWFDPTRPEEVPQQDARFIRCSAGFHVVYGGAFNGLRNRFPQIVYLTNPVNMRKFPRRTEVTELVCEWNGNAAHGQEDALADIKGIHHIIRPACKRADLELRTAEFHTTRIPHNEMNNFYCNASVAVCMSKYEGASNSVMEAMASGLIVVATDVGNHSEMQASQIEHIGVTGIVLVERTTDALVEALEALKQVAPDKRKAMGDANREEIAARWSWEAWKERYCDFFRRAL